MRSLLMPALALLFFTRCFAQDNPPVQPKRPTHLHIASGTLVGGAGAPIQVHGFEAEIEDGPQQKNANCAPEQNQKVVTIRRGTAFISTSSLATLLNSKLQQKQLQDINVSDDKGKVKITGKAKKTVTVPFTIEGPISLTPQGYLRLTTEKMKVGKIPGLAALLGINPEKMVGGNSVKGVQAEKDAIVFDPDLLWGLPVHGTVTQVGWQASGLTLQFGHARNSARPQKVARSKAPPKHAPVAAQK